MEQARTRAPLLLAACLLSATACSGKNKDQGGKAESRHIASAKAYRDKACSCSAKQGPELGECIGRARMAFAHFYETVKLDELSRSDKRAINKLVKEGRRCTRQAHAKKRRQSASPPRPGRPAREPARRAVSPARKAP